ncbi:family 16 glycosylhydrolase [Streptomyces alkaliphilus]|uniref:Family 16 glycosylhydrolase n=1 Tax=Streptomyces alkaliphilus TaxID=1472722 RepID=A0A7W3TH24_9ACTN|nr:glycoside hydrolase family 16 protein [Streptomyces alkaliphilus]MBB0246676.1 family 16 glycosylhydrolase [Streptomyces alkaliphilus]
MGTQSPARSRRRRRPKALIAGVGALLLAAGTVTTALGSTGAQAAIPPAQDGWELVWGDDFEGPAGAPPSAENWQIDIGHSYPGGPDNWGTGEIQYYTDSPDNIALDGNGNLRITALREGSGRWTSARIETHRADFKAPEGGTLRIEGRMRLPNVTGEAALGYWPAFWALGSPYRGNYWNWPGIGEFDIMENVNGLNTVWGVLHCGTAPGGPCDEFNGLGNSRPCPGATCQEAFHTYGFEWDRSVTPNEFRWYVDGERYHRVHQGMFDATTWANMTEHAGYFLLLNLAMGGAFPDGVAGFPTPVPATQPGHSLLVDHVAVWTRGGNGSGGDDGGTSQGSGDPGEPGQPGNPSVLHLRGGGGLGAAQSGASSATLPSADGANHDGSPHRPQTFLAEGVNARYTGGDTRFELFVDAGTTVANGQQVRISYDHTGNGTWDRTETYRYFATDPEPGWERYTESRGLASSAGSHSDLVNGRVRVEIWNAIGNGPSTVGIGNLSTVTIPHG